MPKRTIKNYEVDLLALLDAAKAMNRLMNVDTRRRVLTYIVKRELGDNYEITKKAS